MLFYFLEFVLLVASTMAVILVYVRSANDRFKKPIIDTKALPEAAMCPYYRICKTVGKPSTSCMFYYNLGVEADAHGDDAPHRHTILKTYGPYWHNESWQSFITTKLNILHGSPCYSGMRQLIENLTQHKTSKGEIY